IGHEVSHTFDAEGSACDAKGAVRNWWTPADLAHFEASTQKLVEQYDAYRPFPDLALNGKQTIDENIADVAGIGASLDAYHASLNGKKPRGQAGFKHDQEGFLGYVPRRARTTRGGALGQQEPA